MTKLLKFVFVLAVALVPMSFSGCGGSTETTVVETEPLMTEDEEAEYIEETMGAGSEDTSQN